MTQKQRGVFIGMVLAVLFSITILITAVITDPFHYNLIKGTDSRITILGLSLLLPVMTLIASIGRLAGFRFFSPADIDGSGLTKGSEKAILLQSLLQNTLEQFVIATAAYTIWCFTMPTSWLSAVPCCSFAFLIGRISFFKGYHKGAPARAFGFALTFYPTVLLVLTATLYHAYKFVCQVMS